jgi:phytoene dehydrogenase-like protein
VSDVIIIGGGHNGLAAAYYLAKAGLEPIVLEQRDSVGGGAITGEIHPGFSCPTLTHHTLLHAGVAREMNLARHGVVRLASATDLFAAAVDAAPLVLSADVAVATERLKARSMKDADAYAAYVAAMARVADGFAAMLTTPAPDVDRPAAADLWNLVTFARRFRSLGKRDAYRLLRWVPMPVADLISEWFDTELLRAALCAPGLSGTMLGPRSAGSGLVLLLQHAHARLAGGMAAIRGGPGVLTQAMAAAARDAGAEIRTTARVERVLTANNHVTGVATGGRELPARVVVSALDPKSTFLGLVDPGDLGPDFRLKMQHYRAAGTVAKVNLALSALPAFPGASAESLTGRVHIGPTTDYMERAFDRAKYGEAPDEPWLDAAIPSILDPDLAPRGCHVMSIYVHYAARRLRGGDWTTARQPLLEAVLKTLDRFAPGARGLVVAAQVLTPADLEGDYGFSGGHIFHGELALDQLFAARPALGYARYEMPIHGLYLCGAGTHPGGFMTGTSGRLAAREVLRARRRS